MAPLGESAFVSIRKTTIASGAALFGFVMVFLPITIESEIIKVLFNTVFGGAFIIGFIYLAVKSGPGDSGGSGGGCGGGGCGGGGC